MAISDSDIELIVKYIDESLTEDEKLRFNELQESSPEFQEEIRESKILVKGVKAISRAKRFDEVKSKFLFMDQQKQKGKMSKPIHLYPVVGAAAVISILIVAYVLFFQQNPIDNQRLFTENFEAFPMQESIRNNQNISKAHQFYAKGDYQMAITLYEEIALTELQDAEILYLTSAYLHNKQQSKAAILLEDFIQNTDSGIIRSYAKWYLALSYISSEEIEKSKAVLSEISSSENVMQKRAKQLLEEL